MDLFRRGWRQAPARRLPADVRRRRQRRPPGWSRCARDRSILDSVTDSFARLEKRLGVGDRRSVNDYLDSIREVELRIQKAEANNASTPLPTVVQPAGVPEEYDEHAKLLLDLLMLGYQADITRVSCMQIARESSSRTLSLDWRARAAPPGVASSERSAQHPAEDEDRRLSHVAASARLVEKMSQTPDGDGTLLDHSILVYGAGMGDGDHHTPIDLPVVLVGGGGGRSRADGI